MNYTPLNSFLLIEKKTTSGLAIAGQDEDPNATLFGMVIEQDENGDYDLQDQEVVFVRGQSRKIKLEGKEYFLVPEDKILLCQK